MIRPGNIYSGYKERACFTNPTELAFKKGVIDKHYPIEIDLIEFADAEAAYQYYTKNKKGDFEYCKSVCELVIRYKLEQYPELINAIELSGGLSWIEKCSHFVYGRGPSKWEGIGRASAFIDCLYKAYEAVINNQKTGD